MFSKNNFSLKLDSNIIVTKIQQEFHLADIPHYSIALCKMMKELGIKRVLVDATSMSSSLSVGYIDAFMLSSSIDWSSDGYKRAILVKEFSTICQCYERYAIERGQVVKIFTAPCSAISWLSTKE